MAKIYLWPKIKGNQKREIKIVFNTDIARGKGKHIGIRVPVVKIIIVIINNAQASSRARIPIETAVNVPHPLVNSGQFKGIVMPVAMKSKAELQPIALAQGTLIIHFRPETVTFT